MDDAHQEYTGSHLVHLSHISEKFTKKRWDNISSLND